MKRRRDDPYESEIIRICRRGLPLEEKHRARYYAAEYLRWQVAVETEFKRQVQEKLQQLYQENVKVLS